MKTLFLILAALPAFGQSGPVNYIATTGNVSLSSQTTAATLQQPATGQTMVTFPGALTTTQVGAAPPVGASVYCSAACVATISRTCTTAASATAGTVTSILPNVPAASVTFWTASNASSCVTLRVVNVAAGQEYPIDLSDFNLATFGTKSSITISIASVTATVNISFFPVEQH